ncbi:DUF2505 domain-containing protein [Actinomyces minihominis]|uniref:DUF2505 domain-containing protein n=1 Tax=Actinomyces minihominis TaxID=2002838 RepID=UPI000C08A0D7|nr:DUF2505 domain-containing protein [Actinomyces minihominis]
MKFTESYMYDAPVTRVWDMLSDPTFVKARNAGLEIPNPHVESDAGESQILTTTSGEVPPSMIPPAAQRFLKGNTKFVIHEEWRLVNSTKIHGTLKAQGQGVPASLSADVQIVEVAGGSSKVTMNGDIKVNIPFLGAKLERQALGFAPRLIKADTEAASAWLSNH